MARTSVLGSAAVLAVSVLCVMAQGGPGPGEHRPKPPLETALDANGDGVIDAGEIANAPTALKKLDKNGDGKLTPDEYRPPRPPHPEGQGPEPGK